MENRIQGLNFSISADKAGEIGMEKGSFLFEILLDYPWPNSGDHQNWLDTAPVNELQWWALGQR